MYRSRLYKRGSKFLGVLLAVAFGYSSTHADPMCGSSQGGPDKDKNWYTHAQSNAGQCCCGDYDGIREGTENPEYGSLVEWTIVNGHYRVRILPPHPYEDEKPEWYDVPDSALVKEQDRNIATPPPVAEVWTGGWYWDYSEGGPAKRSPKFRCLHPGAGM